MKNDNIPIVYSRKEIMDSQAILDSDPNLDSINNKL
jgi:hypothetical protein